MCEFILTFGNNIIVSFISPSFSFIPSAVIARNVYTPLLPRLYAYACKHRVLTHENV